MDRLRCLLCGLACVCERERERVCVSGAGPEIPTASTVLMYHSLRDTHATSDRRVLFLLPSRDPSIRQAFFSPGSTHAKIDEERQDIHARMIDRSSALGSPPSHHAGCCRARRNERRACI